MSKKLTLVDIKKDNKKYSEKKRVDLPNGDHVFIYPHFSLVDRVSLVKEMLTEYMNSKELGLDFVNDIELTDWISLSILYKFADLGIPKDLKKKRLAFHELLKYEHTAKILLAYPQESLDQLIDTMESMQASITQLIEEKKLNATVAIEQVAKMEAKKVEISK